MRLLRSVPSVAATFVVALVVVASASAAGPPAVWVGQAGVAETQLSFVSGCFTTQDVSGPGTLCADGPLRAGPDLHLTASGVVTVRLDAPANEVHVAVGPPASAPALPVARVDDTHWDATLPAALVDGHQVTVVARGGPPTSADGWDSSWVGTLRVPAPVVVPTAVPAPPATPSPGPSTPTPTPRLALAAPRVHGRTVRATVKLTGVPNATFTAHVALKGHRVSTKASGLVRRSAKRIVLRLDRRTAAVARRSGQIVVRAVTAAGQVTVSRVPLAR